MIYFVLVQGYYLHQNFVAALLSDLFGIQSRGGCMCAGPYGQILLGIDRELARKYEEVMSQGLYVNSINLRRIIDLRSKMPPHFTNNYLYAILQMGGVLPA